MKPDYKKLGLKCGIEIHQQLNTKKLFCDSPSQLRDDKPDILVRRKQYAVAGETGKVDTAAAYEQARRREFIYEGYSDTNCQVEFDSEPPQNINEDALLIALQIALLLNAKPFPVIQVMRKTVIDGSNTSGFQRTALIATNGYLKTRQGKVGIATICLEEDSARIIKSDKQNVTYRLDRLGIPLVEIATSPDIKSPEQAREVAAKLGEVLRACNVKRGIGTIRQDVNLSIAKGARVEIKGVQELSLISKVIESETKRQREIVKQRKKVKKEVRKAQKDGTTTFLRPMPGEARMYPETDLEIIRITSSLLKEIKEKLPKLREEEMQELEKLGLNPEIASQLLKENKLLLFKQLLPTKVPPRLTAQILVQVSKSIKAHYGLNTKVLTKDIFEIVLKAYYKGKITKDAIEETLAEVCRGTPTNKAIKKFEKLSQKEAEKKIRQILKSKSRLSEKAIMGLAMKELRGKADGQLIAQIVKKLLK